MTERAQAIGVLGGTFDPVHCAHLRLAIEIREQLQLHSVRLLPAARPQLRRAPAETSDVRVRLLEAAVAGLAGLEVDTRELARSGPTYTVDTLEALRAELPGSTLFFIVGADAFARLHQWHRWRDLLDLCHLVVASRPGASLPRTGPVAEFLTRHRRDAPPAAALEQRSGCVIVREITRLDISATRIRALLAEKRNVRFLVPDPVHELLTTEGIYARRQ